MRVWWDPELKELTLGENFEVVTELEGQTTGTAPTLMGDWLVAQNNGNGSYGISSLFIKVTTRESNVSLRMATSI